MNEQVAIAPVRKTVHVKVPIAHAFETFTAKWQPDAAMKSEVDVRFTADGPDATDVELVHHRFETLGAEAGVSMRGDVDRGWPGLLARFAAQAERSGI